MTSQPQTTFGSGPDKNAAPPAPLDRSSAEWRSQFGVLPSPLQQSATARPTATVTAQRRNPASLIAAAVGIIGVGGLIAYGYFPQPQAVEPKNEPEISGAVVASGNPVKQLRDKAAAAPLPAAVETPVSAPSGATTPAAITETKPSPVIVPSAAPVKLLAPVVATKPEPRRVSVPAAVPVRKPEIAAPRPRREASAAPAPAVRDTPAPAAVAAAPTPRPERKPVVQKTVARPVAQQQLPKASRPASESIESDGTNPLGLPQ